MGVIHTRLNKQRGFKILMVVHLDFLKSSLVKMMNQTFKDLNKDGDIDQSCEIQPIKGQTQERKTSYW